MTELDRDHWHRINLAVTWKCIQREEVTVNNLILSSWLLTDDNLMDLQVHRHNIRCNSAYVLKHFLGWIYE